MDFHHLEVIFPARFAATFDDTGVHIGNIP
jgi:hypothetical protein